MDGFITVLLEHIGAIFGLIIIGALIALTKRIKGKLVDEIIDGMNHRGEPVSKHGHIADYITCDSDIYKEIHRTMFELGADRVGLYQFHNGNTFSSTNPIWKVSNTHEVCENGISTEIGNMQDIKSSLMNPIVTSIIHNKSGAGISMIKPCQCEVDGLECNRGFRVFEIIAEDIKHSYCHAVLLNRHTVSGLLSAIIDDDGQVIGFVLAEYTSIRSIDELTRAKYSRVVCNTSTKISQMLANVNSDTFVNIK